MKMEIETANWEIPLRYYKGWTINFCVVDESFNCPILCLFGFSNTRDLEKAIDRALQYRETGK
jgi:hypothetical protein